MARKNYDELNDTTMEAPGGTQATHSAVRDYFRDKDINDVRGDIEREIRDHPLRSLALALGAGYLIAKIFD